MDDIWFILKYIIPILFWIIIWWLTIFASFFYSWTVRRRKTLLTFQGEYSIIKKVGSITIIAALLYYIVLFGIFDWQFRWSYLSFLFGITIVLILDKLLIAYYYDKNDKNEKFWGIKTYWLSKIYTSFRGLSIISFIAINIFLFVFSFYLFIIFLTNINLGIPEMYVDAIKKNITFKESSVNEFEPFKQNSFRSWEDWMLIKEIKPSSQDENHNFANKLIFTSRKFGGPAIYIKKGGIFKKYLYSTPVSTRKLYYSENNDTLFLDKPNNWIPQNFIVKEENIYVHTFTKIKSSIPNLSYSEKLKLTLKTAPDKYETFTKIIK